MDQTQTSTIESISQNDIIYIAEWRGLTSAQKLYLPFKRVLDIVLSIIALIICSPLFLIVAIAIKIDSKGPVFYHRECVGKNGKSFPMHKFRSMVSNAERMLNNVQAFNEMDGPVFKMKNDPRITRIGRIIRKFSIDELPQFVNVFLGQMSIVGPRPNTVEEVSKYTISQQRRLIVTPGITCYWQVSGRNELTFSQWVTMDMKYIESISLLTDIKILIKTIPAVLSSKGAY